MPRYGGALFAPGDAGSPDSISRALALFESACFDPSLQDVMSDADVARLLDLLTRTKATVRQGRATATVTVPVDFSDLSSEYIGILYEGLLDYELKRADEGDPVLFLNLGDEPALPLSRLTALPDAALSLLVEKLRQKAKKADTDEGGADDAEAGDDAAEADEVDATGEDGIPDEEMAELVPVQAEEPSADAASEVAETNSGERTRTTPAGKLKPTR